MESFWVVGVLSDGWSFFLITYTIYILYNEKAKKKHKKKGEKMNGQGPWFFLKFTGWLITRVQRNPFQ